ncbi:MAG: type secretion system protein GspG [Phycisphaerales bacterium]|nr:type secretion system protein GspG [Phycisphaerales bacterium]
MRSECGGKTGTRAGRPAFSLIEFTAVLALIGLLAGAATLVLRPIMAKGKQNAVRGEIVTVKNAIELFYTSTGRYPTSQEGLDVLTKGTDGHPEQYLSKVPTDPWGRPYAYVEPGRGGQPYEVICLGKDGREGGTGENADLTSADLKEPAAK